MKNSEIKEYVDKVANSQKPNTNTFDNVSIKGHTSTFETLAQAAMENAKAIKAIAESQQNSKSYGIYIEANRHE